MTFTQSTIEATLDAGELQALMSHGKWWRVRRNGRTKTWVRTPGRFRIPIKSGIWASREEIFKNLAEYVYDLKP